MEMGKINKEKIKLLEDSSLSFEEKMKVCNDLSEDDKNAVLICADIPQNIKKYLINKKMIINTINRVLNKIYEQDQDLFAYIMTKKVIFSSDICSIIGNNDVLLDIKDLVINTKITEKNILEVIGNFVFMDRMNSNHIKALKPKEYQLALENIEDRELLSYLTHSLYSNYLKKDLVSANFSRLVKLAKRLPLEGKDVYKTTYNDLLLYCHDQDLIAEVTTKYPKKTDKLIKNSPVSSIMDYLDNDYFPISLKEEIISVNKETIDDYIKDVGIISLIPFLRENSSFPKKLQESILTNRKDAVISYFENEKSYELPYFLKFSTLKIFEVSPLVKTLFIKEKVDSTNFINLISNYYDEDDKTLSLIFKEREDLVVNYFHTVPLTDLLTPVNPKYYYNKLITDYPKLVKERLSTISSDEIPTYLNNPKVSLEMKKNFLNLFGFNDQNASICLAFLKSYNSEITTQIIENYDAIVSLILKSNIDLDAFIQYGSGSYKNNVANLLKFIKEEKETDFINVTNYLFTNYYQPKNDINKIDNFLEIINNYHDLNNLLINITTTNYNLTTKDKKSLYFLFNINDQNRKNIHDIHDINNYRLKLYESISQEIITTNSIDRLKEIFNDLIFMNSHDTFDEIGGSLCFHTLKKQNKTSQIFTLLAEELIKQSTIIDMVKDTNNLENVRSVLKYYLLDHPESLSTIQESFTTLKEKIRLFFEADANINLTHLDPEVLKSTINENLSKEYGTTCYDLQDKNYVLCAHVLSYSENVDDLVIGKSNSKNNFISLSAVSYLGQKYYYGASFPIFAYDNIPEGSFICSSTSNMGTNDCLKDNSLEVAPINRKQRGILESSAIELSNSEFLLYREGLVPKGLIIPKGRIPTELEQKIQQKYHLPYFLTQNYNTTIDSPKSLFSSNNITIDFTPNKELDHILNILNKESNIKKEDEKYTGREIAIITDLHAFFEPTLAVLEAIRRKGISEIYSLGDNIEEGPNPSEVLELLDDYNVTSLAGNSEYYHTLGTEPFKYLTEERLENNEWTHDKLSKSKLANLTLYKPSLDLTLGGKKIALCHFANDIRWDFIDHDTWTYQANHHQNNASSQFLYTNSKAAKENIQKTITTTFDKNYLKGYLDATNSPLFAGKQVTDYDAIIQGHVHFQYHDQLQNTDIYTLRALGMGYDKEDKQKACYYVLKEKKNNEGFDIEKELVPFNHYHLVTNIKSSTIPHKEKILKYVNS